MRNPLDFLFTWFCVLFYWNEMIRLPCVSVVVFMTISSTYSFSCDKDCLPEDNLACGYDEAGVKYKMFPGKCALDAFKDCYNAQMAEVPLSFCIKDHVKSTRRYGQSCPVFCPPHYRPVCAASKMRDYVYRSFTNGCQLDMLNCRGDEEYDGYVEVPLAYCPRHGMRNIFKDQIIASNLPEYRDYDVD